MTLVTFLADNYRPMMSSARRDLAGGHPVLDLALTETAVFAGILPSHYGAGGIRVVLHYTMSSAVANNVNLATAFEKVSILGADTYAAARVSGDVPVPAVADTRGRVSIVHSAAETDGLVRGDFFLLRVQRMAAIGADAAGDLELLAIELLEA